MEADSSTQNNRFTYTSKGSTFFCRFCGSPLGSPPQSSGRSRAWWEKTLEEAASCSLWLKIRFNTEWMVCVFIFTGYKQTDGTYFTGNDWSLLPPGLVLPAVLFWISCSRRSSSAAFLSSSSCCLSRSACAAAAVAWEVTDRLSSELQRFDGKTWTSLH